MPNGREFKTCEYITYSKIDGCGKGESVNKEFAAVVPKLEADNKQKLCTSVVSNHLTVQYFMRCFVQYKSIFEAAVCQGHVVEFPIFVLPKPETEVQVNQPDQSYKVQGLPAEFDHEEDLADCFFQHKKENYWNTLGEPKLANQWQVQLDFNDHRDTYSEFLKPIKDKVETMPVPDVTDPDILPVGIFTTQMPWVDETNVNDPEWRK